MKNPLQKKDNIRMQKAYVYRIATLLEREDMRDLALAEKGYADSEEANALIFADPTAFIFGLIFDQSIRSSAAWKAPLLLRERLGHLDVRRVADMDEEELQKVIAQKKTLHRYPKTIAHYISSTCKILVTNFSGEARNVWESYQTCVEVKKNFLTLVGVGEKKANLAVLMLVRDFQVALAGVEELPLPIDVHLQRVLKRSGHFESETSATVEIDAVFRNHYPQFPALLSTVIWLIGRRYCHARSPQCQQCPLAAQCLKKEINDG